MTMATDVAGVPPKLREQRLDASGVDGESVWLAESSQPQDDAMGFALPPVGSGRLTAPQRATPSLLGRRGQL